jgi:hypothetical protein
LLHPDIDRFFVTELEAFVCSWHPNLDEIPVPVRYGTVRYGTARYSVQ